MNMKLALNAFLSTALVASSSFAAPIVNKLGKNPFNTQIAAGIEAVLGGAKKQTATLNPSVSFYETFPAKSMLNLNEGANKVNFISKSEDVDSLVMTDYVAIGAQSAQGSSLGLRMTLAPLESRLKAAQQLAENNVIQTGDAIVSVRPLFANSLQYLALQLLSTHISTAVVVTENGKKVVYNIDMPMDADMLGGKAVGFGKSVMDSGHFVNDNNNMMLHILRPRLTEEQRSNIQKWFEKSLAVARAKTVYPSKLSFNSDYNAPMYKNGDLGFVADTGRLLLGQGLQQNQHLQMFCSEFAWTVLSLRNCNPDTEAKAFSKGKTPSCISEFFKPMQTFGSAFTTGAPDQEDYFGMTDGIPMLIQQTGADVATTAQLISYSLPGVDKEAKGLSSGHKGVAAMMAPLIQQTNPYFNAVMDMPMPKAFYLGMQQPEQVAAALENKPAPIQLQEGYRMNLNQAAAVRNYSPTGFVVHAAMPNEVNGTKVAQKKFDYVTTIKYVPRAKLKELQSK
jgi:hypothetical protein